MLVAGQCSYLFSQESHRKTSDTTTYKFKDENGSGYITIINDGDNKKESVSNGDTTTYKFKDENGSGYITIIKEDENKNAVNNKKKKNNKK